MAIKNFLGQVETCFGNNKVDFLTIFISLYFVKGQSSSQNVCGRLSVLNEHYKLEFKATFLVVTEKSYGQIKMRKVKLCKCAVASIVNGFQKYFTSRMTLGLFKK